MPAQKPTIAENIIAAGINSVVRLSESLSDLEHAGTLGLLREALVESVICPLLVPPYKAATGVVIDCNGNQSGQCDIIIWDDSIFRPFYFARGAGLFAIESVVATIEVKSVLKSESEVYKTGERAGEKNGKTNHFKQVLRNARKLSQMACLNGAEPYDKCSSTWTHPANAIFAFDSDVQNPKDELERMGDELRAAESFEQGAGFYVQGITIPGKKCWQYGRRDGETSSRWLSREPDIGPSPDFREVRMNLAGFLNSLRELSRSRGCPRIGNYVAFRHGPS